MQKLLNLNNITDFIILVIILTPIVIFDIKQKRIPNIIILPGIALILLKKLMLEFDIILLVLLSMALGFGIIWLLWFFSKGKIGLGDAKLSCFLAGVLGLVGWFMALFVASLSGLIYALVIFLRKKFSFNQKIPFAPFLAFGSICAFFLKDVVANYIFNPFFN